MSGKAMREVLDVYLQGRLVGQLCSEEATLGFIYDTAYLQSPDAIKLSASLPLQAEGFDHLSSHAFFSGFLPDEDVRRRLAG